MSGIDIKRFREKLGLTQAAFAAKLGVAVHTVCRWETSFSKPSPLAIEKIKQLKEVEHGK